MADNVLITGGTGMIGKYLSELLVREGYEVGILTREKISRPHFKSWTWDIDKGFLDPEALQFADHIIHLAGANIAGKKWTATRKKEILDSRVKTAELLYNNISRSPNKVKSFISSSGSTYYGWNTGSILMDESRNKPGDDFLATVTREWEASALRIGSLGIRTVILRNGVVLWSEGGFLKKIIPVVNAGLGAGLGKGDQYISWIHIKDLSRIILSAIRNSDLKGIYNAVSPEPVTNKEMMKAIASTLHKPFFLPNVPAFVIRMVFGEMSSTVLGSNRVSGVKIESAGFNFEFKNINEALNDLLKK